MIHVAASRVFKRPKWPSAVDKAVGAVNINFPFSMQGQNRAEKVSSKALDRYSALLLARILREVFIILCLPSLSYLSLRIFYVEHLEI